MSDPQNRKGQPSDDAQRCTATTRSGERCTRPRLADADVCLAHSPDARERGFGGAQANSGPKPTPDEYTILRQRLEANVDRYLSPIERAIDSDDVALGLKAMAEVFNRLNGTPKQSVDVAHSGGLTIEALFVGDPLAETHSELPEEGE